jgi:ribosomal protein L37AE/L43A
MSGERAVPFHCPFCGEEDLRPAGAEHGTWECRDCTRVFKLSMVGMRVGVGAEGQE